MDLAILIMVPGLAPKGTKNCLTGEKWSSAIATLLLWWMSNFLSFILRKTAGKIVTIRVGIIVINETQKADKTKVFLLEVHPKAHVSEEVSIVHVM